MSAVTTTTSPEAEAGAEYVLRLSLDAFEGPLDLLLHLIRKHELNIFDIPIAFITEEYLKYLEAMVKLDLGIVGEYLVMAATLLQIKSAMLLPKPPADDDENEDVDPREELIRRLLEYQKFKDAAQQLQQETQLYRDTFPRPEIPSVAPPPRTVEDIEPPGIFELIDVYQSLLKRQRTPVVHEVTRHELSIKEAITRIATFLERTPRTTLTALVAQTPHSDETHRMVITFMSVLEMAKLRLVRLFQARITGDDLVIERAVIDIAEIALTLDFSEPETVLLKDGTETEQSDENDQLQDTQADEEDEQLLAERLASLRGRPRLVRRPDLALQDAHAVELAKEEAELLALANLHHDLDSYDVDAMLAQAMTLSQNAVFTPDLLPSTNETHSENNAATTTEPVPPSPHEPALETEPTMLRTPPKVKQEEASPISLKPLQEARVFEDFVAHLAALEASEPRHHAPSATPSTNGDPNKHPPLAHEEDDDE